MDQNRFKDTDNGPVCMFGPGGDFVTKWSPKVKDSTLRPIADNPIGRVLATIAEVIGATVNPELLSQMTEQTEINRLININLHKEEQKSAELQPDRTSDTAPTGGSKADIAVRREPMLFADDCGVSKRVKRKPHHRVRAHHRASKKRTSGKLQKQGTLFEIDSAGQSAA
jgi:hypothetical protein